MKYRYRRVFTSKLPHQRDGRESHNLDLHGFCVCVQMQSSDSGPFLILAEVASFLPLPILSLLFTVLIKDALFECDNYLFHFTIVVYLALITVSMHFVCQSCTHMILND